MDRDYGMQAIVDEQEAGKAGPSFAVANLTGGVGKTTMTRLLHYMWLAEGVPLQLVSVDSIDENSTSKLASLGEDVEQMTISPDTKKVSRSEVGNAHIEHWTRMGDILSEGGRLIDFGANAVQYMLDWAENSKPRFLLEDSPPLTVIVPVTSIAHSAQDGLAVLKRFFEVEPEFMKLNVVVAFNEKYGVIEGASQPIFAELRAFMAEKGVKSFTVTEGTLNLTEEYTFTDLATVHPRDFGKRVGISPMLANTRLRFFTNWLDSAVAAAAAAGLGPKKVSGGRAA